MFPARLRWLWLTLAVVLLDRASKALFESQTVEGWHRELIHNFVYLVHSRNPGIAFGVFADSPSMTMRIVLIIGSAAVIGALAWLFVAGHSGGSLTAAGLAFLGETNRALPIYEQARVALTESMVLPALLELTQQLRGRAEHPIGRQPVGQV